MQNTHFIHALIAALAVNAAACTADTETSALDPEDLPDNLSGFVFDGPDVVSGVEICVYERDDIPCATSDDKGHYDLRLPHAEDIMLRFAKEGHRPKLRMHRSEGDDFLYLAFQPNSYYQDQSARLGVDFDDDAAIVVIEPGPGKVIMISPQSGDGPYYFDNELNAVPDMTETGEFGVGAFVNVEPGTYYAGATSMSGESVHCTAPAWRAEGGTGEIHAVAGHNTSIDLDCDE